MEKFKDDVIDHKESDIEKIQTKPNMYISYLGEKGALHLCKESINNMIDECINPNSPADQVDIYLDEETNTITISDNGRGIPFDKLELVCTKLQAGSKFTREGSGGSAGENGVGMTAVNALSDLYEVVSIRYKEKAKLQFYRGKKVSDISVKKITKDDHGSLVTFKPSPIYLGEDCMINTDELIDWVSKISYLMPTDKKLNISVNKKGKESVIQKKFRNKDGLYDYCKKLSTKPILDPIHFMKSKTFNEFIRVPGKDGNGKDIIVEKELKRFMGLEVAFTFNSGSMEMIADSFCNFVNTVDNGTHVEAVKQGITWFFSDYIKNNLTPRESKTLEILNNDITQGLVLTVYLSTDMQPQFSGQTKEKMTSISFIKPLKMMTHNALYEHFNKNPKELKKIVDHIKMNCKARIEATRVRNSVIKGETTSLDEYTIKNLTLANNKRKDEYREIYLIEGDSAGGSAKQGRFDNDTQALFAFRGVPLNAFGLKLDKVLLNEEFKGLIRALKCNIGERFDISKLWYDKIIIMTDADIDGYRIFSMICAFFLYHAPEIIKQGHLYKAVTPLYKIVDKDKPFLLNKLDYIKAFEGRIRKNINVIDKHSGEVFDNDRMKDFLLDNREYLEELIRVANHFAIDPIILEFIVIHMNSKDFKKKLKAKAPELFIDSDNVLSGIYNGKYQILIIDKIFDKRIRTLKDLIYNINKGEVYFKIHEIHGKDNFDDKGVMSIGEFLTMCQKYQPIIESRYKGLGELEPSELRETTLDPNDRVLINLTMDDVERELERFNILHGSDGPARKEMMKKFKIKREDIDN